jgi:hypothetical protein
VGEGVIEEGGSVGDVVIKFSHINILIVCPTLSRFGQSCKHPVLCFIHQGYMWVKHHPNIPFLPQYSTRLLRK